MRRQQLIGLCKFRCFGPKNRKRAQEFLKMLHLASIPAADKELHGDDTRNAKSLCRGVFVPTFGGSGSSKTIDQNVGVDKDHLGGAFPALDTQTASELDAIDDVGAVSPHSKEF